MKKLLGLLLLSSGFAFANSTQPYASNSTGISTYQALYPGVSQQVAIGASSTQATAFGASTSIIKVFATSDCFISIGTNPVANTTTSMFVPGGIESYYGVVGGSQLAVIQKSASGTLYITAGN